MGHTGGFGADIIDRIAAETGELINLASVGRASWDDVNERIAAAFPGSFSAIFNRDMLRGRVKALNTARMDATFARSFANYYSHINPWNAYWARIPSGHVGSSEREHPGSLISDTEFYNDWVVPQDVAAASGLKLDAGLEDTILVSVHYPLRYADQYDAPVMEVLRRARGNLQRAVDQAVFFGEQARLTLAAAALVERTRDSALAVEIDGRVVEANRQAATAFEAGLPLRSVQGRASFSDPVLDRWFLKILRQLLTGQPVDCASCLFEVAGESYRIAVARLPEFVTGSGAFLVAPRSMALVMIRRLATPLLPETLAEFARLFKLTQSETRMCAHLAGGASLQDSAAALGITYETARQRVKLLFSKTGVHRQSELVALISNFVR